MPHSFTEGLSVVRRFTACTDFGGYSGTGKRVFDLSLAILLLPLVVSVLAPLGIWILLRDKGPVFYGSTRVGKGGRAFRLWKLRTMTPVSDGGFATGGDKAARITAPGKVLRRTRLDELPQIWNVLKGDMSFVGPRPPLPRYVNRHPGVYARVLRSKPGLTGLATLTYHRTEVRVLADCTSPEETDALYSRLCVPRKARLDLIYQRNTCLRLDLALIARTVARLARTS